MRIPVVNNIASGNSISNNRYIVRSTISVLPVLSPAAGSGASCPLNETRTLVVLLNDTGLPRVTVSNAS